MLKYIATILIVSLLTTAAFPQSKKLVQEKKQMLKQSKIETQPSTFYGDYITRKNHTLGKTAAGTDLMFASYDWIYNNFAPNMLVMYDLDGDGVKDPIGIATDNSPLDGTPVRHAVIGYIDELGAASFPLYGTEDNGTFLRTGSNSMLILDEENNALYPVVYDHLTGVLNNYIWAIDLTADITAAQKVTNDGYSGGWPRATLLDNGEFWSIDDATESTNFKIMKSTDGGLTFDYVREVGEGDEHYWFDTSLVTATSSPLSSDPLIESNGSKMAIFMTLEKSGTVAGMFGSPGDAGIVSDLDSADMVYYYYSTDHGATWQGEVIGYDGAAEQISNRPLSEPLFQNFGLSDFLVDKTGVTHLVLSGTFGANVIDDTLAINTFPIYYWNDQDRNWIAVTNAALENYYPTDEPTTYAPANMVGNNNPTIAVSDDGNVVAAVWTVEEFTGEWGNSDINMYPGDGGANTAEVYFTDVLFSFSSDGGKTWSEPADLEAENNVGEQWPILSSKIEVEGDQATINYMYYIDPTPGSGIVTGANDLSPDARYVYNSKTFTIGAVSVNDDAAVLKNYSLEQNYPNPFNPGTDIKFTLAKAGNVSLKVYDILGREVANLVNGTIEAGAHTVNFNASNLSSGVYLYTIKADNFSMTKKMMLMK